jgi:ADP-heptose:LPS heptosyltransferase
MTPRPRTVVLTRDYTAHGMNLLAGETYVVEDPTLAHLLTLGVVGDVGRIDLPTGDGRVLISRTGGFGDLLFCTPLVRALQARGLDVSFSCVPTYLDALSGVAVEFAPYPLTVEQVATYGRVIWLEGVIEFAADPSVHAVDLISQAASEELTKGKHCSYRVAAADAKCAAQKYPRTSAKRIGVQLAASAPSRTYPRELMMTALSELLRRGHEVYLFGRPGEIQINTPHPRLVNTSADSLSFARSCAVLATCDAVLAPDSALCHVAGALNIPTVALYAPFSWRARTAYAPSVHALSGNLPCAPCHHHGRGGPFPESGPCYHTGRCEALATIEPSRVVRELEKALAS